MKPNMWVNDAFSRIGGYGRHELIGSTPSFLKGAAQNAGVHGQHRPAICAQAGHFFRGLNKQTRWLPLGVPAPGPMACRARLRPPPPWGRRSTQQDDAMPTEPADQVEWLRAFAPDERMRACQGLSQLEAYARLAQCGANLLQERRERALVLLSINSIAVVALAAVLPRTRIGGFFDLPRCCG